MTRPARRRETTRTALLRTLPEPDLDLDADIGDDLRRIELRRSILELADIDHVTEVTLVRAATARRRSDRSGR